MHYAYIAMYGIVATVYAYVIVIILWILSVALKIIVKSQLGV